MRLVPSRLFWRGPWPWVIAAAAVAAVALFRWQRAPDRIVDPRPIATAEAISALKERTDVNVLFILIDTLRAERLRTYGYGRATSPVFDVLAGQGVRFARHMAQSSWTKCSMASLWTGLYPARAGVTRFEDVLPQQARLAAEVFRDAGFRTAGIWRNGWVEAYFGFDQGFEVYTRPEQAPAPTHVRRKNPTVSHGGTDMDSVNTAVGFLRIHGRDRWFLYLHLMDVHEYTYDENSARFGATYSDVYDNAILHVNGVIDALLGHLLEGGYLTKTLIVIGSDHGEAFGERGTEGHARNVYPETTEVPLILSFPFRFPSQVVIPQRTANVAVGEPRTRLIFDDRYQDRFKPLVVFPPPVSPADAKYVIGPQGSVYLACEKPIDPASVRDGDFRFEFWSEATTVPVRAAAPVAARARLLENEPVPAVRPRPSGVIATFPDGWTRQRRAALIEITPRQPLTAGVWRLWYDPQRQGRWPLRSRPSVPIAFAIRGSLRAMGTRDFSLRDFSAEPVLDPGWLPREIRVEPAIGAPGHGGLTEDFADARRRSPIAVGGADGTAYWSDLGRVEVRYPAAAGSGADGDVRLRGAQSQRDVEALSLTLAAGETCTLDAGPGLVVLRAQGRISIAGRLARATEASAPAATLAAWQRRPADARPLETLSAWLAGVRERDEPWTVLIAGGDLVIDGELTTTTPLCLCAGGVIRVSGAVRGVANQVFLLREGGGLNIDPPASLAPLSIDPPRDRNPLVRPLHLAVLSSPIPPSAGVLRWLSAEARGSGAPPGVNRGGAAAGWRVRYVPEIRGDRADLAALAPAASPIEFDRPDHTGPLQILIELVVEPGDTWDPPWVDFVRLAWEQGH